MSELIRTDYGWQSVERDPVEGHTVGISLVHRTGGPRPTHVRTATLSAAHDFPYDHDRSADENAADSLEQWLEFRHRLKDWYVLRDQCETAGERAQLPALAPIGARPDD